MAAPRLTILGSFVADLAFRTPALPQWGETVLGSSFSIGPGGKGSNQAVAAARLGGAVEFITKLGCDAFGDLARELYAREGVGVRFCRSTGERATGAAAIVVHASEGQNAIVVVPGSSFALTRADVEDARPAIAEAAIFLTQLELPLEIVEHALRLARAAGVTTMLNPAPAVSLPDSVYQLCDWLTPNETEAAALAGRPVTSLDEACAAADAFLARGVGNVALTLGARGALLRNGTTSRHVAAVPAGAVVDTTGAGDAFNAGLAIALAEGRDAVAATQFACAVAGISVTRHGTALSMPTRDDVEALTHA